MHGSAHGMVHGVANGVVVVGVVIVMWGWNNCMFICNGPTINVMDCDITKLAIAAQDGG